MERIINEIKAYFNLRLLIGIAIGAAGGYLYYFYVGCESGTCAITSNPVNSTLYGMLMGAVLFLKKSTKPEKTDQDKNNPEADQ